MLGFWIVAGYLAALGLLAVPFGRLLARLPLDAVRFPFRSYGFERGGAVYEGIGIRRWKDRVPDMSRVLKKLMPPKKMSARPTAAELGIMVRETCVAELSHTLLSLLSLGCLWLWPSAGGAAVMLLYILLGNLPFIFIQRYNRPKLLKLQKRMLEKEK